jgi:ABC-2 type transport system permease protein
VSAVLLVARRELSAFFRGTLGYVIISALLLLQGLLFQSKGMASGKHLSSDVLVAFFWVSFGVTAAAGILLTMRLFAGESRDETLVLLYTAPINDWQIVLGKWLSAYAFVLLFVALTFYMPLMVAVNGSVHPGHIAAGYLGLTLVGAASTAIGLFTSSLTKHQLVAGVFGGITLIALVTMWMLAKVASPPMDGVFSYLSMFDKHFMPFAKGVIHTRDVVYYLSLTFLALVLTRVVVGARRWR